MRDNEYEKLKSDISYIMGKELNKLIEEHGDDDESLYELKQYVDKARKSFAWDIEKAKVVLSVLQLKNNDDVQGLLSYLDRSNYGWQGQEYKLYNRCLRFRQQCRKNFEIRNDAKEATQVFGDIDKIFFHEKYGAITTYLFGYSIAALFCSRLKNQNRSVPYFLQIACKDGSNTYRVVHEIVHICDVNTGLFNYCTERNYGECDHDHMSIIPVGNIDKALESMIYYRDIPVIVEGYTNERLYEDLLREVANIFSGTKRFDLRAKINVLPIFLSPMMQLRFRNVFSMDLTDMDIEDEYYELIFKNRQRLGSWVFELVMNVKHYFGVGNSTAYIQDPAIARIIEARKPDDEVSLFYNLDDYISRLKQRHNRWTNLTLKDFTNIGELAYFFSSFMRVFGRSIRLSEGVEFIYRTRFWEHNPKELIEKLIESATDSLFELHDIYAPTRRESINVSIAASDVAEEKRIRRKGEAYAKDIVKYYHSYGVSIQISSDAEYKDDRYVFSVKLMPGTDTKLISGHADDVRRLLNLEVLTPHVTPNTIKLIASEKILNENNLLDILKSEQFKKSGAEIPYAVGYDTMGEMVIADIAEFPHLLIGGASGTGKSSAIHSLLMSIVCKQPADKVKLLLLDFGASGLKMFDNVPHMLRSTIKAGEIEEGCFCMFWLQNKMEERLRKKDAYDERRFGEEFKKWPSIVCIIDEFPAFIHQLTDGKGNKKSYTVIEDLLSRARKVKIHLILAAQNTTKNGIGINNTNLAAGIAFKCTDWHTSKAIIGGPDATKLSGKGFMYFRCDQYEGIRKLRGSFMPSEKIMDMLDTMDFGSNNITEKYDEVKFETATLNKDSQMEAVPSDNLPESKKSEEEQFLMEIVEWIWKNKRESVSNNQLKDNFKMGYNRANVFLRFLEKAEIVSAQRKGTKLGRTVDLDKAEYFLKQYGCLDSNEEDDLSQVSNVVDEEGTSEENIDTVGESADIQEAKEGNPVDASLQLEQGDKTNIDVSAMKNAVKSHSYRDKFKKWPAH